MKRFHVGLLVCWLTAVSFGAVNARNGISVSTDSTINGRSSIASVNGQTLASGGGGATAYRYYRFRGVSEFQWWTSTAELFATSPAPGLLANNAADLTFGLPEANFSQSSQAGTTNTAVQAFDDDDAGTVAGPGSQSGDYWIKVDLGTAQVVHSFNIKSGFGGGGDIALEGSNDNSAWTVLYTIVGLVQGAVTTGSF